MPPAGREAIRPEGMNGLWASFNHPPQEVDLSEAIQVKVANPLLTRPKKYSSNRQGIMDLSWPLPPAASFKRGMQKDTYLGVPKSMHLPLAQVLAQLICQAGKGTYLYSCDIAQAYRYLPLDLTDWPLICFKV